METNDNNNLRLPSDFQPPLTLSSQHVIGEPSSSTFQPTTLIVNPRISTKKKRSKFIRIDTAAAAAAGVVTNKPTRKPDPSAPEITRPCTECGRKFWSWKALFGHMRCHPERRWRGINPPPNFRRTAETNIPDERDYFSSSSSFTEEDHEVAACLLMLAHTPTAAAASPPPPPDNHQQWASVNLQVITPEYSDSAGQNMVDLNCGRFECASCKKVFGSHQALGGHRASHKNVKGCYAITKNSCTAGGHHHHHHQEQEQQEQGWCSEETTTTTMLIKDNNNNGGHKCSICFRVFSSGQALGGHMRCHWEKDEPPSSSSARVFSGFDLNLAAAPPPPPPPLPVSVPVDIHQDDDDDASSSSPYCTNMALDLRLGL